MRVLISFLVGAATAGSFAQPSLDSGSSRPARAATHSVHWEQLTLGDAVERLKAVSGAAIVLDRRVDPDERINLSLRDASVDDVIARLSAVCSLGHIRIETLFYMGPREVAERLPTLAIERRREIFQLPADQRRGLVERRRIVWPRLSEPRGLIVRLVQEHGWRVEHSERIPHDLWPAGELPKLALTDQLTILLAGFDRTYRISPERQAIEIVPVDWDQMEPTAAPARMNRDRKSVV